MTKRPIDIKELFDRYQFKGNPTDKDDVHAFLLTETSNGMFKKESVFSKCFPELYKDIMSAEICANKSFSERLFIYFNPLVTGLCKVCGQPTKFHSFKVGYPIYCSSKCSNTDPDKKESCRQTVINRYGVENVSKSSVVKDRICNTFKEKYGVEWVGQSKEVQAKQKATCIARYGVATPFEMDGFKDKSIKTCRMKYGTDHAMQSDAVKTKIQKTYRHKTGYTNPSFNPDVIKKRMETNFQKYNGKWFTQTSDMIDINHSLFLERHPDIIRETQDTYVVSCSDPTCTLCTERSFEIDKNLYIHRSSQSSIICPIKSPHTGCSSIAETGLLDYIKSIYNGEIISGDRKLIYPLELDIVIPEKKISIEFNGIFWHSDFNPRMHKKYHQDKSLKCNELGYQLLHIWEDDWYLRQDIIKDYIKSKLHLCSRRVHARKCEVREIDSKSAASFVNTHHIQGYVNSTYKIGLFYGDELVEVMLVGKLRNSMGSKPKEGSYEIYRVVSCRDTEVTGGFSKMLKYFERTYHPSEIITYGDLCYTNGNVYKVCGFEERGLSAPCYSWTINGIRYHRSNFMKCKLEECKKDPSLTEDDVMRSRHAYKVWDAGKLKFVKNIEYYLDEC